MSEPSVSRSTLNPSGGIGPSDPALNDRRSGRLTRLATKARYQAWMLGDPRHLLRDDQLPWLQAIHEAQARGEQEFLLYLGRQNGKTHFLRYAAIRDFLQGKIDPSTKRWVPGNVAFASKSQRSTKDIVGDLFKLVLDRAPKALGIRWVAHENRYVCANGGSLWLFGLEQGAEITRRGQVFTSVYIDEAAHIVGLAQAVKDVLGAATLKRDAMIVYATTPPKNPGSSFYEIKQRCVESGCFILRRTTEDPTIMPYQLAALAKKLGGTDSPEWRREVLCEEVAGDDALGFPDWGSLRATQLQALPLPRYHDRYDSMDLGFHPDLTFIVLAWYKAICQEPGHTHAMGDPHVHVFREVVLRRYSTATLAEEIRAAERACGWDTPPEKPGLHMRIGDMDGSKVLDLANDYDLVFTPTAKHNKGAQVARINDWLRNGRMTIDPGCKLLDKTLLAATRKVDKDGDATGEKWEWIRSKELGHMDGADAVVYLGRNVIIDHDATPADARGPGEYLKAAPTQKQADTRRLDRVFQSKKRLESKPVRWPDPRRLP